MHVDRARGLHEAASFIINSERQQREEPSDELKERAAESLPENLCLGGEDAADAGLPQPVFTIDGRVAQRERKKEGKRKTGAGVAGRGRGRARGGPLRSRLLSLFQKSPTTWLRH